ncbi:MAG: SPASM domain-containing protein [Nanoarchaeota archaeon]|nr:SPASM domain-containing protein [Nanoarchaeota archaeon]
MIYKIPEFPLRLEIEPTSACNLRCTYCPRRHLKELNTHMDFKLFKKIIKEAEKYPDRILVLHRRGESLLYPQFKEMLNLVAGKFKEVQLATNATLLTPDKYESLVKGLTFISFSIDIPKEFDKTRLPAKYKDVENKILDFLEYNNRRIKTQVSMVKTDKTPNESCEIFNKIWTSKVDRVRIYEEHSIEGIFGSLRKARSKREPCVMPFYEVLIYYDGKVGRCAHDWSEKDIMGDINTQTIKEIWNNKKYQELRKQHQKIKFKDEVCKNCDSWYPEVGLQKTGYVFEKKDEEDKNG